MIVDDGQMQQLGLTTLLLHVNMLRLCQYKRNAVQMTCPITCFLAGISDAGSLTASSISIFKHCQHLVFALNPLKRAKNRWKLPKITGRWTFQHLRLHLAVQRIELRSFIGLFTPSSRFLSSSSADQVIEQPRRC